MVSVSDVHTKRKLKFKHDIVANLILCIGEHPKKSCVERHLEEETEARILEFGKIAARLYKVMRHCDNQDTKWHLEEEWLAATEAKRYNQEERTFLHHLLKLYS
tara:strand:- start:24109 stop:24420 length:312 start_codon:yes stop_codon:yes gene_type:complete